MGGSSRRCRRCTGARDVAAAGAGPGRSGRDAAAWVIGPRGADPFGRVAAVPRAPGMEALYDPKQAAIESPMSKREFLGAVFWRS